MEAAHSTLYLQQKRERDGQSRLHSAAAPMTDYRSQHASTSSPHPAKIEGDADVDVGLNQWAGQPGTSADAVTAQAEAAMGEEEDEEEDSEVLEEEEANAAAYNHEAWDGQDHEGEQAQGDEVVDDPEEDDEEKSEDGFDDYDGMLDSDTATETVTWIKWYCSLPGHDFFAEVDEDYIEDEFNMTGLSQVVPFYKEALEMILDVETLDEAHKVPDVSIIESSAELLYGLIHQRFITTRRGLSQMLDKYELGHFGACPRVFCHLQPVLPCGRSDLPGLETVKLYCPNCMDCYQPPSSRFAGVDGAYFGTSFPHLFLQTYRDLEPSPIAIPSSSSSRHHGAASSAAATDGGAAAGVPSSQNSTSSFADGPGANAEAAAAAAFQPVPGGIIDPQLVSRRPPQARIYTPRIYGFKVSEHAKTGPRMRWMRMRPGSLAELESEGLPPPPPPTATSQPGGSGRAGAGAAPDADSKTTGTQAGAGSVAGATTGRGHATAGTARSPGGAV